jgi:hypothetical protein
MSGVIAEFFALFKGDSSQLQGEFAKVKNSLLGQTAAFAGLAVAGVYAFTKIYDQAAQVVKVFTDLAEGAMKYGLQVEDMARITGDSVQETSMLIQAADDARISYEQLTVAMKMAVKQGIDPSLSGLMELADQYNALETPISRDQFLLKTFGRNGLEMGKLMELGSEGIKKSADEAEKLGLVLGPEAIENAKKYFDAIDKGKDAFTGLSNSLGQAFMPALTDATNTMTGFAEIIIAQNLNENAWNKALKMGVATMQDYDRSQTDVWFGRKSLNESTQEAKKLTGDYNDRIKDTTTQTWLLDAATRGYKDTLPGYISLITGAKESLDNYILDLIAARNYIAGIQNKVAVITIITRYLNEAGVEGSVVGFDNKGAPVIAKGGRKTNTPISGYGVVPAIGSATGGGWASGGYSGGGILVGERGPEVISQSNHGYIAPNDTAQINITDASMRTMAKYISDAMLTARA